jgi:hypothetical protein
LSAATAYRKAARSGNGPRPEQQQVRAKALLNLAIVNLELAGQAIAEYDRGGDGLASGQTQKIRQHAVQEFESARSAVASRSKRLAMRGQFPAVSPESSDQTSSPDWRQSQVLPGWPAPEGAQ